MAVGERRLDLAAESAYGLAPLACGVEDGVERPSGAVGNPPTAAHLPVILLDTFEDAGARTHRDFERLLQRVVWMMPDAFFGVTGRNRLQWAQTRLEGQPSDGPSSSWRLHSAGRGGRVVRGSRKEPQGSCWLATIITLIWPSLRTACADD